MIRVANHKESPAPFIWFTKGADILQSWRVAIAGSFNQEREIRRVAGVDPPRFATRKSHA
jgi:hypothetical protein